ncbi:MAG: hypothetical protein ACRDKL_03455 [Solirubrobacteraceae bacterium]
MTVYGGEGTGAEHARAMLGELIGELRTTSHVLISEWNPVPGAWIAELNATYELKDFSRRGPYHRAILLHAADGLIQQLHVYGTHELPLPESEGVYREVRGPHGWLPTL